MKRTLMIATLVALTLPLASATLADKPKAGERDKPWNAHDVMETAFKGKDTLYQKMSAGKATDKEQALFLKMVQDMQQQDPPKGDSEEWKGRVAKMISATEAIIAGDEEGAAQLKAASNCKACHTAHRPPKD